MMVRSFDTVSGVLACCVIGAIAVADQSSVCSACDSAPARVTAIQSLHRAGAVVVFVDGSRYSTELPATAVTTKSVKSIRYFAKSRDLRWSRSYPSRNPSLPGSPNGELIHISEAELGAILLLNEVQLLGLAATDIDDKAAARLAALKNLSILELGPDVSIRQGEELKKAFPNAAVDY